MFADYNDLAARIDRTAVDENSVLVLKHAGPSARRHA